MAIISAIYATLLMFFFSVVVLLAKLGSWGHLSSKDRLSTCAATAYVGLLVISGWLNVQFKSRAITICHVALMLGAAGLVIFNGLTTLMDPSTMGGRGPDANPVAGVVYGFGLLELVIGGCCAICGVGVLRYAQGEKNLA
jgi:hypothetical protein